MNYQLRQYRRVLIGIAIAAGFIAAGVTAGLRILDNGYSRAEIPLYYSGKVDGLGNAHFIDATGNEVVIDGNVKQAERTADGQHIITLYESGELVLMDGTGRPTEYIDDAVAEIYTVRDSGFVYEKEQDDNSTGFYRYRYEGSSISSLGGGDYMPADYTLDLIAYDAGEIFLLTEEAAKQGVIAAYDEAMEIELIDIAEAGQMAAWAEIDGQMHYIYIEENGEVFFVDAVEIEEEYVEYASYSAYFGEEQMVLVNTAFHSVYTKKSGQPVRKIDLGTQWYSSMLYSERDLFYYDPAADTDSFFFEAGDETGYHIYYAENGAAERIIDEVDNLFDIRNRTILYATDGDQLYRARIRNGTVIREKQIAVDVINAGLSEDGSAMYYVRDVDTAVWTGSLYYRKEGEDAEKISSAAEAFSITMSSDGNHMFYFEEVKYIDDEVTTYGDLYLWSAEKGSRLIARDVFRIQGIGSRVADPEGFGYFVYKQQTGAQILCDYYYCDGKTSWLVAEDMLR